MTEYTHDYLLDKKVKLFQPEDGYKTSSDAVWLAAAVTDVNDNDNILDVGTGNGAVALCLAERFRTKTLSITGIEKQEMLAQAAVLSARTNGFDCVQIIKADIFTAKLKPCSFAHVVTNPPYAKDDMPSPNASKANAHNFDNADLAEWLGFCVKMLKPRGYLYIINRAEALEHIITSLSGKMGKIEVFPLYSKTGQPAKRIIVRAQKDSKAPLIIHQGIIVHNDDGSYSEAAQNVLRKGNAI